MAEIYGLTLLYDNSQQAVKQRKSFLKIENLGICDIVHSCYRQKIDASDFGMEDVKLRDILGQIKHHPTITSLVFLGGNSKNGPEYFFRKQLKEAGICLECSSNIPPRRHLFVFQGRIIETITLISPSKAANRSIGSTTRYKEQKLLNSAYSPFDYRVEQYRSVFSS